jgi:phosphoribosylformylglycinamidine cyclo-ligase
LSQSYKKSGVDIDAGAKAVSLMRDAVRSTYTPSVLSDVGNFGGLFGLKSISNMSNPVLVASTDGVGTKTKVASQLNRWDTIGADLVNHCINDILVQGATPLFFLDYVASDKLNPQQIADIVTGMAKACQATNTALLGGETAEMAGVYMSGEVDVVGTIVGAVDQDKVIDGSDIKEGDTIVALPSSGLHTNGFTLARSVLAEEDWQVSHPELGQSIGETLLVPHRCYLDEFLAIYEQVNIRGIAHITGGGITDNLPRILPDGLGAQIERSNWEIPNIFQMIENKGDVSSSEMDRVFNMGLGLLVVLSQDDAQTVVDLLDDAFVVGKTVQGNGVQIV